MGSKNIIALSQRYVSDLLTTKLPIDFSLHNIEHTGEIVKAAIEIGV